MYNEQQKQEASSVILELINFGMNRGAYSSVEVAAIKHATHILQSPLAEPKPIVEEIPVTSE